MDNRLKSELDSRCKLQTLGLFPALNGSKSLGECSPGILIQHFVEAQRTNTGLDPLASGCSCLGLCFVQPQGCHCLIPSAAAWNRGAAPWFAQKMIPDVLVWLPMVTSCILGQPETQISPFFFCTNSRAGHR